MKTYYDLSQTSDDSLPWVFKESVNERAVVRKRYQKFMCTRCGRVDAGAALAAAGLDPTFAASSGKRPLAGTTDYQYVVNDKLRRILTDHCDDVDYYDVQDKGDCFVIWPKQIVVPDGSKSYARTKKCQVCKIFRSTVYGPEPIRTDLDVAIGAVLLEGLQGPMPSLFVEEPLAKKFKSAKLKGIYLNKWCPP